MIIFPIEVTKENTHLAECLIDIPLVLEKENIISNTSAQGILKSSVSEKWKEKGITIDKINYESSKLNSISLALKRIERCLPRILYTCNSQLFR